MNKRVRLIALLVTLVMMFGMLAACGTTEEPQNDAPEVSDPVADQPAEDQPADSQPAEDQPVEIVEGDAAAYLWEIPEDATDDQIMLLAERNFKIIQAFEPLYTAESYKEYSSVYTMQYKRNKDVASAKAVIEAQSCLQQTLTVEDGVWFLWGDSVGPIVDGESHTEEELDAAFQDAYGFKPFLIKYLTDDPANAKGNIVVISGGAMSMRSNPAEGYPAAELFREQGYNCFLLQRRVAPYTPTNIYMDLQRAIRMVRYYAAQEGWGGQDLIAACGFSGGSGTILGTIRHCYGDRLPTYFDSDYVADEIDAINSDLDVAMILYGAYNQDGVGTYVGDNPNLPAFYICHGMEDDTIPYTNAQELYDLVAPTVPAQLYLVEGAKHGFGPGLSSTAAEGCKLWPEQAMAFMEENRGFSSK